MSVFVEKWDGINLYSRGYLVGGQPRLLEQGDVRIRVGRG